MRTKHITATDHLGGKNSGGKQLQRQTIGTWPRRGGKETGRGQGGARSIVRAGHSTDMRDVARFESQEH